MADRADLPKKIFGYFREKILFIPPAVHLCFAEFFRLVAAGVAAQSFLEGQVKIPGVNLVPEKFPGEGE